MSEENLAEEFEEDLETELDEDELDLDESEDSNEDEDSKASEIDYEAKARQDGWCPKEEWRGDPSEWKPAEQFVKDGEDPRYRENLKLKKELKSQKAYIDVINKNLEKIRKSEYEKAKKDLEARRIEAIENQDIAQFQEIDKQLQQLPEPESISPPDGDPYQAFWAKWGHLRQPSTREEQLLALDLQYHNQKYCTANPNASREEEVEYMLQKMDELVGNAAPQTQARQAPPAPTPSSTTSSISSRKAKEVDMEKLRDRAKKRFGNSTVRTAKEAEKRGFLTEREYYQSLFEDEA